MTAEESILKVYRKLKNYLKFPFFVLIVLVNISSIGFSQNSEQFRQMQYNPDRLNVAPPEFVPQSDLSLLTYGMLEQDSFINIRESQMGGYRLLIGNSYRFNSSEELQLVLEKNRAEIQTLIDKTNKHANTPLSAKKILGGEFPRAFFFRKPERISKNETFQEWENEFKRLGGICNKALREELYGHNEKKIEEYMNRFAIDNPEQLVLLHFNGRARDPRWRISKYSAGHWVYSPGCYLRRDVSANDSILYVTDASVFKTGFGLENSRKNDDIVIVPEDQRGHQLWDEAEQVTLVSIGDSAIKILRGRYRTKARSFKSGQTYLAPHMVEGPWGSGNNLLWFYNLSSNCPKDKNGNQCADILSDEIQSWFANNGELFAFDGIEFDIAPWGLQEKSYGRYADINTDGNADGGYLKNTNLFGVGVHHFYEELRRKLGKNKLILADGGVNYAQRAVDVINGMEAEGLCEWNDVYKEFSKPLSFFSYWLKNGITPQFSYVTHKDNMDGTEEQKANRQRMVLATAQCIGVGVNTLRTIPGSDGYRSGIPDELVKGVEDKLYWLGAPKAPMIDLASLKEPLKSFSINQVVVEGIGCQYKLGDNKLEVNSTNNSEMEMKVVLKGIVIPSGDMVVYFEAKAQSALPGFKERIPRQVSVRLKGRKPNNNTADEVLNYIGCKDDSPCSFYFREAGPEKVDVEITIEGGGVVEIQNIHLVNDSQALVREFENGIVLVNPSLKDYTFDLFSLFPDKNFKRLTATKNQGKVLNNGEKVGRTVKVPPLNGLFLIKM